MVSLQLFLRNSGGEVAFRDTKKKVHHKLATERMRAMKQEVYGYKDV